MVLAFPLVRRGLPGQPAGHRLRVLGRLCFLAETAGAAVAPASAAAAAAVAARPDLTETVQTVQTVEVPAAAAAAVAARMVARLGATVIIQTELAAPAETAGVAQVAEAPLAGTQQPI